MTMPSLSRLLATLAFSVCAAGAQAAQTHWYQFNGSLADSQGGPALVANGGTLGAGSYAFGANQGLSLTGAISSDIYTIDITFSFADKQGWSKIADFKGLSTDSGWYRFVSGPASMLEICDCATKVDSTPGAIVADVPVRVTLTRDGGGLLSQYVNGSLAGTYQDSGAIFTVGQPANVVHFFIDDSVTGQGEAVAGSVSRIVIFDSALSATQVATLAPVPEPETWAMFAAGAALLAGMARKRRSRGA